MKRALIISYYFAPQNLIGAVRATKLAKYLTRMGFEVTVICGAGREPWRVDPTLKRDMEELSDVRVVQEFNPIRWAKERRRSGRAGEKVETAQAKALHNGILPPAARKCNAAETASVTPAVPQSAPLDKRSLAHRVANALYLALCSLSDLSFRARAKRELNKLKGAYDAVFSTYSPLSVHEVARAAKKRGLARLWIADFRDEAGVSFKFEEGYKRRVLDHVRREADIVCAASNGLIEQMRIKGRVLNNGFDREDSPASERGDGKRFRAVYCGSISMWRAGVNCRDLTPFFAALGALIERGDIARDELEIVYAGGEGELMRSQAADVGLDDLFIDLGTVTRERSLALQSGADLLFMASVNQSGLTGILTGKLFEYLMAGKPILCCVSGDLPMSETRRVFEETGAGFCYEEAQAAADAPRLVDWLGDALARWRSGEAAPVDSRIDEYSYPALAHKLAGWIDETK